MTNLPKHTWAGAGAIIEDFAGNGTLTLSINGQTVERWSGDPNSPFGRHEVVNQYVETSSDTLAVTLSGSGFGADGGWSIRDFGAKVVMPGVTISGGGVVNENGASPTPTPAVFTITRSGPPILLQKSMTIQLRKDPTTTVSNDDLLGTIPSRVTILALESTVRLEMNVRDDNATESSGPSDVSEFLRLSVAESDKYFSLRTPATLEVVDDANWRYYPDVVLEDDVADAISFGVHDVDQLFNSWEEPLGAGLSNLHKLYQRDTYNSWGGVVEGDWDKPVESKIHVPFDNFESRQYVGNSISFYTDLYKYFDDGRQLRSESLDDVRSFSAKEGSKYTIQAFVRHVKVFERTINSFGGESDARINDGFLPTGYRSNFNMMENIGWRIVEMRRAWKDEDAAS